MVLSLTLRKAFFMFTKKLLLALLFAPTLVSAPPLTVPVFLAISEANPKQNVTWLSSALQLLYSIPEIRNALITSTSTDPFVRATAAFFNDPKKELYRPIYNVAPKANTFDGIIGNPINLVQNLINKGLASDQQKDLFSLQFDKKSRSDLFIDYKRLSSTLKGEGITDQSKYLLIILDDLFTTDDESLPIDIFTCKNNELIGFIILDYKKDETEKNITSWKTKSYYRTYFKDSTDNTWYMDSLKIICKTDDIKNMPLEINEESLKRIFNQEIKAAGSTYQFPVVLVYKKTDVSKESEKTETSELDPMPDFTKALDQI